MPTHYLTAPEPSAEMPKGIPFIVANEAAERFSYYGMRGILVVFMTTYLLGPGGSLAVMSDPEAKTYYHWFLAAVYFFPLLGAALADMWLGKYRTILGLSLVYCLGHLALALDITRTGLLIGLTLIAVGSGGIKPCVSANVGDQFGASNRHLIEKVFGWFYFAINAGSAVSTMLTPWLLTEYGPHVAFGVPGVLMLVATICFWLGRKTYVHVPPFGKGFIRDMLSREGLAVIGKLAVLYLFVAVFWSLYDQTSSAWILQAKAMDLNVLGLELEPAQTHSLNPILILAFIPLFTYAIYPAIERVFPLTPLRKVSIGFFLTAIAFTISAVIEQWIVDGGRPHFAWQALAYAVMTAAEVMVSITCLEFSYRQAPPSMKSLVMALNALSVSMGNAFTSLVNRAITRSDGSVALAGAHYYWFFAGAMFLTALAFIPFAYQFRERTYLQPEQPAVS
jgi:proton-dependent oligopeptide transporter, POT family